MARLAEFITDNREEILKEWESFARSLLPHGAAMSAEAMRDHAEEILSAIVRDMNTFQSEEEQAEKSKGRGERRRLGGAGHVHAVMRLERGFRLGQLVAEFRALRASVLRLYKAADGSDLEGLTRFHEAIDEALTASTNRYTEMVDRYRDQFLAILGHDLRNPLGAIVMGASTLAAMPELDERAAGIASRILNSARRMDRMVYDLLDLTRTRLGGGIPIHPVPLDLAPLCQQVLAELRATHPQETLRFTPRGDLRGEWDGDRLAQVISNLVGNAMQHGAEGAPVTVTARDQGDEVVLEVHNEGPPIPERVMSTLFEPMVRHAEKGQTTTSLGLGLYIAAQIVGAHGGKLSLLSMEGKGTTFTVRLPRRRPVRRIAG